MRGSKNKTYDEASQSLLLHVAKLGKKDRFNPAALRALVTLLYRVGRRLLG